MPVDKLTIICVSRTVPILGGAVGVILIFFFDVEGSVWDVRGCEYIGGYACILLYPSCLMLEMGGNWFPVLVTGPIPQVARCALSWVIPSEKDASASSTDSLVVEKEEFELRWSTTDTVGVRIEVCDLRQGGYFRECCDTNFLDSLLKQVVKDWSILSETSLLAQFLSCGPSVRGRSVMVILRPLHNHSLKILAWCSDLRAYRTHR